MAHVYDHSLTRVKPVNGADTLPFKTSWSYQGSMYKDDKGTEHDAYKDGGGRVRWQYHANGRDVYSGRERVIDDAPDWQEYTEVTETKFGSDSEPNVLTHEASWWPRTRWRIIAANHDAWCDGHQNTAWWPFYEPLPPKVGMKRTDLKVTFSLDPNRGQQGDNSHYWVTRTRYMMYVRHPNQGTSVVVRYPLPSSMATTTSAEKADAAQSYSSPSAAPDTPTLVGFVAANEGPSGVSQLAYAEEYVFSRVNSPSARVQSRTASGIVFAVSANADVWHPVDHIILERSTGSGWTAVQDVGENAGAVRTMADYSQERFPGEDQSTRYRVRVWHTMQANAAVADLGVVLAGKPKAPTIGDDAMAADGDLTVKYTVNSSMDGVVTRAQLWDGTRLAWSGRVADGELRATGLDASRRYTLRIWNEAGGQTSAVASDTVNESGALAAALSVPVIDSLEQIGDGTSLRLTFHYASSLGDGTEVSWSDRSDGWEATSDPSTHDVADAGGMSRSISIVGLDEGKEVWVRCRRYVKSGSETVFGGWSSTRSAIPESSPEGVTLTAPAAVEVGGVVEYSWDYAGDDRPQRQAVLTVNGTSVSVDGPTCSYSWPVGESAAGTTLSATVRVNTGGGWSGASPVATTLVARRPTCVAALAGSVEDAKEQEYGGRVLTAMPLALRLSGGSQYDVTVTAATGGRLVTPPGDVLQAAGDVVAHVALSSGGTACESGILNGSAYDVTVTCTDASTGLVSDPVTLRFTARWASPAKAPTATATVAADGTVTLVATGNGGASDVLNVYRHTADGYLPCLTRGQWGMTYRDPVPVYGMGECDFAVEAVTPDGDRTWAEARYVAPRDTSCTVDWPRGRLVLSYNLEISDDYTTKFEARTHLDGSTAGYWAPGHARTGRVRSDGLRDDSETAELARALGRFAGICFVRAPQGVAFACHADVSSDIGYDSAKRSYEVSVTEVDDDGTWYLKPVTEGA